MKKINTLTLSIALITSFSAFGQSYTVNVPVVRQEQSNWCWDADSKCVLQYYGTTVNQCDIATYAFGGNCCSSPSSSTCNQPNVFQGSKGIMGVLDKYGKIASKRIQSTIPMSQILSELQASRPFILGIMWNGGGGHVVVGCGYNQSTSSITFMDSWQNNGMTTKKYTSGSSMSTNSGTGTWAETLVITTIPTTNIQDVATSRSITIFPNPSNGDLTIQSSELIRSVNIYNTMGQLVQAYQHSANKSFNFSITTPGLYSVQTITDSGISNNTVVRK